MCLLGLTILLEMSRVTVMHFSRGSADKPLCHTKAEGVHGRDRSGKLLEKDL